MKQEMFSENWPFSTSAKKGFEPSQFSDQNPSWQTEIPREKYLCKALTIQNDHVPEKLLLFDVWNFV